VKRCSWAGAKIRGRADADEALMALDASRKAAGEGSAGGRRPQGSPDLIHVDL
jgi:hypothetical protein